MDDSSPNEGINVLKISDSNQRTDALNEVR